MTELVPWLHRAFLSLPLLLAALTYGPPVRARLRRWVIGFSLSSLALATALSAAASRTPVVSLRGMDGSALLGVSELSAPLLPMAALVWVAGLVIAPASSFTAPRARRSALSFACLAVAFSTDRLVWLALCWIASSLSFLLEHRRVQRLARVAGAYLSLSCASFVAGVLLVELGGATMRAPGICLIAMAVLVRKGIVPLHSWMPEAFEQGHLVPTILFCAPQAGTYVAAVILLPRAPGSVLTVIAVAALGTTIYGALLGLAENDARRAVGYLFMSQSALVLAGMDSATAAGVSGSLVVWLSSALASAGLALTLAALESRRGRLSLRRHHGGIERMPLLGAAFLVFGLATVGFPATLGFFGHELLVSGSVQRFPYLGFALVGATALNGVTVVRMYFSLFCGCRHAAVPLALRRREVAALGTLAAVLIAGGLAPRWLAESREPAARALLSARHVAGDEQHARRQRSAARAPRRAGAGCRRLRAAPRRGR